MLLYVFKEFVDKLISNSVCTKYILKIETIWKYCLWLYYSMLYKTNIRCVTQLPWISSILLFVLRCLPPNSVQKNICTFKTMKLINDIHWISYYCKCFCIHKTVDRKIEIDNGMAYIILCLTCLFHSFWWFILSVLWIFPSVL